MNGDVIMNNNGGAIQNITIYVKEYDDGSGLTMDEQESILKDYASKMENACIRKIYREEGQSKDAFYEMVGHLLLSVQSNVQHFNRLLVVNTDRLSTDHESIDALIKTLNDMAILVITTDPESYFPKNKARRSKKTNECIPRPTCHDVVVYTRTDTRDPEWKCKAVQDLKVEEWTKKNGCNVIRTFHDTDNGIGFDRKGLEMMYGYLATHNHISTVITPYVNTLQEGDISIFKHLEAIGISTCTVELDYSDLYHLVEISGFQRLLCSVYSFKRKSDAWDKKTFESLRG